jgi:HK97 family phage major capsid protein
MARSFALFARACTALSLIDRNLDKPAGLQVRDAAPTLDTIARAVEQLRASNDEAIKLRMTKDQVDPLIEERTAKINTDISGLQAQIDEIEKRAKRAGEPAKDKDGNDIPGANPEYRAAFRNWLIRGDRTSQADMELLNKRAMTAGNATEGGYITAPEIDTEVLRLARNDGSLRGVAATRQVSGAVYSQPVANNDNAAGWVSELGGRPITQAVTFGGITIETHEIYAMPAASQTLLDDAFINVESEIAVQTNEQFWEVEATAFITGDGIGKPQGLVLPSAKLTVETGSTAAAQGKLGIVKSGSTSDVSTGTSGAAPYGDALIKLTTRLKSRYRTNARFRMNRFTEEKVRLLKDDNGAYIWRQGLTEKQPSVLLGHPVDIDDHMPDIADGALPIFFGDFGQAYLIVDRIGMRMLRDPFTSKPYVLFYTTKRVGGGYRKTEALKALQTAV